MIRNKVEGTGVSTESSRHPFITSHMNLEESSWSRVGRGQVLGFSGHATQQSDRVRGRQSTRRSRRTGRRGAKDPRPEASVGGAIGTRSGGAGDRAKTAFPRRSAARRQRRARDSAIWRRRSVVRARVRRRAPSERLSPRLQPALLQPLISCTRARHEVVLGCAIARSFENRFVFFFFLQQQPAIHYNYHH